MSQSEPDAGKSTRLELAGETGGALAVAGGPVGAGAESFGRSAAEAGTEIHAAGAPGASSRVGSVNGCAPIGGAPAAGTRDTLGSTGAIGGRGQPSPSSKIAGMLTRGVFSRSNPANRPGRRRAISEATEGFSTGARGLTDPPFGWATLGGWAATGRGNDAGAAGDKTTAVTRVTNSGAAGRGFLPGLRTRRPTLTEAATTAAPAGAELRIATATGGRLTVDLGGPLVSSLDASGDAAGRAFLTATATGATTGLSGAAWGGGNGRWAGLGNGAGASILGAPFR